MLEPIKDLQPIEDIQEIVRYLVEGKVLRVEQDNNGVILVRFNPGKHQMTEVSRDIDKETFYHSRYWLPANVSLNSLIAFNVYLDEDYHNYNNKFNVGDLVGYTIPDKNSFDVAEITEVLMEGDNYFYKITGEFDRLFGENELDKYK